VVDEPDRVTRARDRAVRAKAHELAAHRRAAELHEEAAKLQERIGHGDLAQAAWERAERAPGSGMPKRSGSKLKPSG
jgi:hypothetical protein